MAETTVHSEKRISQTDVASSEVVVERHILLSKRHIEPNSAVTREHVRSLLPGMQQRNTAAVDAKYEELCKQKSELMEWARQKVSGVRDYE